ncbi:MAG: PilZ domain-containing protein [Candidatus Omnitrophica bacterium]|nr:PilZ domain-containing protein [Candidatus Omnitrophota bacterium]
MKILSKIFEATKKEVESFIDDRRFAKRYDVPLKLNYCAAIPACRGQALTKNICGKGLRFPINMKVPKGTMLDLKIEDPHSHSFISSKARVTWSEEFVTGDDAEDVLYEVGVELLKKRLY